MSTTTPRTPQEEHDFQYSPSKWALRADAVPTHCALLKEESQRVRATLGSEVVRYGGGADEQLEIVRPQSESDACVAVVYFHGGMWQALSMADSLFAAGPLVARGATLVAVEYSLAPKATMATIVDQCVRAVCHVHTLFPTHKIYLLGHSAGGHLVAMVLARLTTAPDVTASVIGGCSVSGLFDLAPVRTCYANAALQLTEEEVKLCSPIHAVSALAASGAKLLLVIAERDPPAFRQHTLDLFAALQAARMAPAPVLVDSAGLDHFDIIENLRLGEYALVARIAAEMGL